MIRRECLAVLIENLRGARRLQRKRSGVVEMGAGQGERNDLQVAQAFPYNRGRLQGDHL